MIYLLISSQSLLSTKINKQLAKMNKSSLKRRMIEESHTCSARILIGKLEIRNVKIGKLE